MRNILQITKNTVDQQKSKNTGTEFEGKEFDVYAPISPVSTLDYQTDKHPNFRPDTLAGSIGTEYNRKRRHLDSTNESIVRPFEVLIGVLGFCFFGGFVWIAQSFFNPQQLNPNNGHHVLLSYRDFRNTLQKLDAVFRHFSISDLVETF